MIETNQKALVGRTFQSAEKPCFRPQLGRALGVQCHRYNMLWGWLFLFVVFSCHSASVDSTRYSFKYQYSVPSEVTFDFTKSYSVPAGSVVLLNKENQKKKFRYINNSPVGYLFNRKTKKTHRMQLTSHNADPETGDSIFWAFLGSGTVHTPVAPYGSTRLTLYLNINTNARVEEVLHYLIKNYRDLEYHIFNPENFPPTTGKNNPPDAKISSIKVIVK